MSNNESPNTLFDDIHIAVYILLMSSVLNVETFNQIASIPRVVGLGNLTLESLDDLSRF